MLEALLKDLRYSFRIFRQSPAFASAAVAALALGIGANTAIFSVVNAVLLKPVAFPDPDRIVMFMNTSPQGTDPAASPAKFQHYRAQTGIVQDVAAFRTGVVNYTGGTVPEQLRSGQVSADFFRLFGAPIVRGRTFSAEEDSPQGPKVVVLSARLWERRFQSDPDIIGKTISLSGDPYTVIGVLGRDFDVQEFGPAPEVWMPFQLDPNTTDQGHYFRAMGRLKPGVTLEQAKARMEAIGRRVQAEVPERARPEQQLQRRAAARGHREQRAIVAARAGRRGQLRAADRLRQRRQPAARAGDRAPARDRDPRRRSAPAAAGSSGSC